MKDGKQGFTLIEMLVVIGIIGILSSAVIFGYGRVAKAAERAKAVELVSNARTALEELRRSKDGWPQGILKAPQKNGFYVMGEGVAKVFAKNGLLNVDCSKGASIANYKLRGKDRCGIVSPWAQEVLMKMDRNLAGAALLSKSVPSGGTVENHLLYFAVDQDEDGFVSKAEGAPGNSVRATAIVWCAGADGGLSDCSTDSPKAVSENGRKVTNKDNVYSWERAQEDK